MLYDLNSLREELEGLARCINVSELYKSVVKIALNHIDEYENPQDYFTQIIEYGCASGIVTELIYYYQTEDFFKEHMEDIFDLYNELKEELGEIDMELSANNLAWLGFEETIRQIANDIEIDF